MISARLPFPLAVFYRKSNAHSRLTIYILRSSLPSSYLPATSLACRVGEDVLEMSGDTQTDVSRIWDPTVLQTSNPSSLFHLCYTRPFPFAFQIVAQSYVPMIYTNIALSTWPARLCFSFSAARSVILDFQYIAPRLGLLHRISL